MSEKYILLKYSLSMSKLSLVWLYKCVAGCVQAKIVRLWTHIEEYDCPLLLWWSPLVDRIYVSIFKFPRWWQYVSPETLLTFSKGLKLDYNEHFWAEVAFPYTARDSGQSGDTSPLKPRLMPPKVQFAPFWILIRWPHESQVKSS